MKNSVRSKRLYTLVSCALLIAMEVVLTRFLSIRTPIVRIGFGFVPLAVAGMMFGPVYGFAVGGIADLLGATLFPSGPFHPGFTLVTAMCGLMYGLFLYHRDGTPEWSRANLCIRIGIAVCVNSFVLSLCINTIWLSQMWGEAYLALLPPRIIKEVVMACVKFVTINSIRMVLIEPLMRRHIHAG